MKKMNGKLFLILIVLLRISRATSAVLAGFLDENRDLEEPLDFRGDNDPVLSSNMGLGLAGGGLGVQQLDEADGDYYYEEDLAYLSQQEVPTRSLSEDEDSTADPTSTEGGYHGAAAVTAAGQDPILRSSRMVVQDDDLCDPDELDQLVEVAGNLVTHTTKCDSNLKTITAFMGVYQKCVSMSLLLGSKANKVSNALTVLDSGQLLKIAEKIPKVGPMIKSLVATFDKLDELVGPMGSRWVKFFEFQDKGLGVANGLANVVHTAVKGLGFPIGRLPGMVGAVLVEASDAGCCVNVPGGFLSTLRDMNTAMGACAFQLDIEFPNLLDIFNFEINFKFLDALFALIENINLWIQAIVDDTLARLKTQIHMCCSPFLKEVAKVVDFATDLFNLVTCWTDGLISGSADEAFDVIFGGMKEIVDGINDGLEVVNGALAQLNQVMNFDFKYLFNNSTFPSLSFAKTSENGTCFVIVDGSFDIAVANGNLRANFAFIEPLNTVDADGAFDFLQIGETIVSDCYEALHQLTNGSEKAGDCCALARISNGIDPAGLALSTLCTFNYECASGRCDGGLGSTCQPLLSVGSACNEDSDCQTGRCLFTCKERVDNGGGCLEDTDCKSLRCDLLVCQAKVPLCSACVRDADCESGRCPFFAHSCYPADGGLAPTLVSGKCSCTIDAQCESGRCSSALLCEDKLPNGGSCRTNSDCISGRCDGVCKAKMKVCEQKCNEFQDCESGYCALALETCYPWGSQGPNGCKCFSDLDCEGLCKDGYCTDRFPNGHFCLFDYVCQSERCYNRECMDPVADGGLCDENSDCISKRCDWVSGTKKCAARLGVCAACSSNSDCISSKCILGSCYPGEGKAPKGCNCLLPTDCLTGLCHWGSGCKDKLALGEFCTFNYECVTGRCDDFTCKPLLKSCESCKENSDCESNLCAGAFLGLAEGACYPAPGSGPDGCKCTLNLDCESKRCEDRVCRPRLALGASCRRDQDCSTGSCIGDVWIAGIEGVCATKVGVCQACSTNDDCTSGRCPVALRSCYPTTGAAPEGCNCAWNPDCQGMCSNGKCTSKRNLCESCVWNGDCTTGRCATLLGTCYPSSGPAPDGCKCAINTDCQGYCDQGTCRPKKQMCANCALSGECLSNRCPVFIGQCFPGSGAAPNGCKCVFDLDCISGRCDGTCMDKVDTCQDCNEDSDCKSGRCGFYSIPNWLGGSCYPSSGKAPGGCKCKYPLLDCQSGKCTNYRCT